MAVTAVQGTEGGRRWLAKIAAAAVAVWRRIVSLFATETAEATGNSGRTAKAAERRRRKELRRKLGC